MVAAPTPPKIGARETGMGSPEEAPRSPGLAPREFERDGADGTSAQGHKIQLEGEALYFIGGASSSVASASVCVLCWRTASSSRLRWVKALNTTSPTVSCESAT
jgi:hypothetical protein